MSARGLTGGQATRALAALAVTRALRGKAVWVATALLLLPVVIAGVQVGLGHEPTDIWRAVFRTTMLILPIVPSILIASSLADELEDKTAAYLWSRALPRWTIVAGKLVGLAPITAVVMVLGATVSWIIVGGPSGVPVETYLRGVAGLTAGAVASGTIAAMWATLVPRHAVAASIVWLLFVDFPLGGLPINLQYISASFSTLAIAGFEGTLVGGLAAFVGIVAVTTTVAIWRIGRME